MLSLIYVSTVAQTITNADLEELAREAAEKNARREITGMLAYNGFNFMQLLEGGQQEVEERLGKIKEDRRHSGVVVIRREDVDDRECGDWSMTTRTTPVEGLGAAERITKTLPTTFRPDTRVLFSSFASLVP